MPGLHGIQLPKVDNFRQALPQDDSNDSDDRQQYLGQVLFQRYTAQTRDVESNEQSIDNNVENGASRIHPNLSEYIRIDHFTVVCLVAWPLNESEAGVDLVLIEPSLLFICKLLLISITCFGFIKRVDKG